MDCHYPIGTVMIRYTIIQQSHYPIMTAPPKSPVFADDDACAQDGDEVCECAECGGHHGVVGVPHAEPQLGQHLVLQHVHREQPREGREVAEIKLV